MTLPHEKTQHAKKLKSRPTTTTARLETVIETPADQPPSDEAKAQAQEKQQQLREARERHNKLLGKLRREGKKDHK